MRERKTRIIVSENRELFRKGLVHLLDACSDLEVIAEASTPKELMEHLRNRVADIVLLDGDMPLMNGKSMLETIRLRFQDIKTIVLSDHSDHQVHSDFMARGANSFLYKNCSVETLLKSIRKVKKEGYFFDDSTSMALLNSVLKEKQKQAQPSAVNFNDRETDILKKICDGKTNKEIAMSLHLSASTIDFYRARIYGKTSCNSVMGLLKFALKNGIVQLS